MTVVEAARAIGCHPRHVRWLITTGRLRATKGPRRTDPYSVHAGDVRRYAATPQPQGYPRGASRGGER